VDLATQTSAMILLTEAFAPASAIGLSQLVLETLHALLPLRLKQILGTLTMALMKMMVIMDLPEVKLAHSLSSWLLYSTS
jgi:hypothetical protein